MAGVTAAAFVSCSSVAIRFFISSMTALVCWLACSKALFAFCCSAASSGAAVPRTSRFLVAHSLSTAMAWLCTSSMCWPSSWTWATTFSNALRIRSS